MRCTNCGTDNRSGVSICIACGAPLVEAVNQTVFQPPNSPPYQSYQVPAASTKSKTTAGLLALLLGGMGVHKFYLGEKGGIWYLLFFWTYIPAILALIDAIRLFSMSDQEFAAKYH